MTTVSVTTTYGKLADAGGAARKLRERLKDIAVGSLDATAGDDLTALAKALETATAAHTNGQDQRGYVLTWSTSGSNDATTKTAALDWLYGTPRPPTCGLAHGHGPGRLAPKLGDDLATLINALAG
jgi:hypothetical protein